MKRCACGGDTLKAETKRRIMKERSNGHARLKHELIALGFLP